MAKIKHFADINGQTIELIAVASMKNSEFAAKFPGVKGRRYDSFSMFVGVSAGMKWSDAVPVTRVIQYKSFPSKHVCDARCMGATGKTMNCECSCGGKNHGRGFNCEAAA
jgi:hypothetical protein